MVDIRKPVRCTNCGNESSLYISSELDMSELLLAGKCTRCGNSMQITYNIVGKEEKEKSTATESSDSSENIVNIEESLMVSETPSDTLKDIMEE